MLERCKSILLLSDVATFCENYRVLAESEGVQLTVEKEWNDRYRVSTDRVILGSKYLPYLNKAYYGIAVIILRSDESPVPFMKEGISHFIFNYTNQYELLMALFKQPKVIVHAKSLDIQDIIRDSTTEVFRHGDYDFNFARNNYFYRGKPIYLQEAQKKYLAEWLLHGNKDNKRRMIVCNLRKKFGSDFLKDVDRFGNIRRFINE